MRQLLGASVLSLAALLVLPGTASAGVTGPAFYVDGDLYRTVLTPTDLSGTGAPESSFDVIYEFFGAQANVAEAAPGDPDYNGGRWMVKGLAFTTSYQATLAAHDLDASGVLDSAEEVESALADGGATGATVTGVLASFECPVIPLPRA